MHNMLHILHIATVKIIATGYKDYNYIYVGLTDCKVVVSGCTAPSTVGSHNTDSVVHIVLSNHSDRGRCEDSSRELDR